MMESDDLIIAVALGVVVGGCALIAPALALVVYGLIVIAIAYFLVPRVP